MNSVRVTDPPKQKKLPDDDVKALQDLKNKIFVVLPVGKGNSTVVMDGADYEKKAEHLLDGEAYAKILHCKHKPR